MYNLVLALLHTSSNNTINKKCYVLLMDNLVKEILIFIVVDILEISCEDIHSIFHANFIYKTIKSKNYHSYQEKLLILRSSESLYSNIKIF